MRITLILSKYTRIVLKKVIERAEQASVKLSNSEALL